MQSYSQITSLWVHFLLIIIMIKTSTIDDGQMIVILNSNLLISTFTDEVPILLRGVGLSELDCIINYYNINYIIDQITGANTMSKMI